MKRHRMIRSAGIGSVVCCFLLGSCSSPSAGKAHKTHTVEIRAMQFQPSELTVTSGDTVLFLNKDLVVHNVTEANKKAWASAPLEPTQTFQKVITETAEYFCSYHPAMKGKIVVPIENP